jgi:uncharacterized membrane protein YhiD involved in acid resistance
MTFQDIFKSDFLQNVTEFSFLDSFMALVLAFILGLFIFVIYKKTYAGIMYSSSFAVSIIAMSVITCFVILAVTSNIVLSLGMVGALSIVRFRTAVKDPMDIAFLFWAIACGIVLGAGQIPLAILGSVIIGIVLVVFSSRKPREIPYILVVNCTGSEVAASLPEVINDNCKRQLLKSKTVNQNGTELIYEVRLNEQNSDIVNILAAKEGVLNAVLVSYNGEYMQ